MNSLHRISTIGVARENSAPENPGARDPRVAIFPGDVARLVAEGASVSVEDGAGAGLNLSNESFAAAGATIESPGSIYRGKDLVIKIKGPGLAAIDQMEPESTLMCMAHVETFPERRERANERGVSILALEEIRQFPCRFSDEVVVSGAAVRDALKNLPFVASDAEVVVVGFSSRMEGAIRTAARSNVASVRVVSDPPDARTIMEATPNTVFFYDSQSGYSDDLLRGIRETGGLVYDIADFERDHAAQAIEEYLAARNTAEFGKRRVEFLHGTGQDGAWYGIKLLQEQRGASMRLSDQKIVILGYGNIAIGAIDECIKQGARELHILGRTRTASHAIERELRGADLIINGADLEAHERGQVFLITREHTRNVIKNGAVVIDLVGGSEKERSAIENIVRCTFLNDPVFVEDGVTFSAIWGWPMVRQFRESAATYSRQITDLLVSAPRLLNGMQVADRGVRRAFVAGPAAEVDSSSSEFIGPQPILGEPLGGLEGRVDEAPAIPE